MTQENWICFLAGSVAMGLVMFIAMVACDSIREWRIRRNIIKKQRNNTHDHEYL